MFPETVTLPWNRLVMHTVEIGKPPSDPIKAQMQARLDHKETGEKTAAQDKKSNPSSLGIMHVIIWE